MRGPAWVYIESGGPVAPPVTVRLRQIGQQFVPDAPPSAMSVAPPALVVPVGSTVDFPNDGPDLHNVNWITATGQANLGTYRQGQSAQRVFAPAGAYPIGCNLHPSMNAHVLVVPNAWVAKTDGKGHYRIPNVTPGMHRVVAWSPSANALASQDVVVEASREATFSIQMR